MKKLHFTAAKWLMLVAITGSLTEVYAQAPEQGVHVTRQLPATPVKSQGATGTCWCFSTTAVVESECLRKNLGEFDLSEMFTVRNIYLEKARNYVRRQGKAQFDEGGLGHDVLNAITQYGAMPESAYSGLVNGARTHDHQKLVKDLRSYLTDVLKKSPVPADWEAGFTRILDDRLGVAPQQFEYQGKTYTPRQFVDDVLQFHADDYIGLTSYSHHPFYQSFIVEIPDNWANGSYLNVPVEELSSAVQASVAAGYTVMWDADVSNPGWGQDKGFALEYVSKPSSPEPDALEKSANQQERQRLFDTQVTTDDHLMQITGLAASPSGKKFYLVKNSWGEVGPFKGYIYVSEPYFALNTVTVIVPKAVLPDELKAKIH